MKRIWNIVAAAGLLASGAAFAAAPAWIGVEPPAPAEAPKAERGSPYIRVVEDEATGRVRLQLSVRSFRRPDGTGPTVSLASAIHIADESFYRAMQTWLDGQDLVLFEGIKPPGSDALPADATDEQRTSQTRSRLELIGSAVERFSEKHGELPRSLDEMADKDKRFAAVLRAMAHDGWGRELLYTPGDGAFELRSLGADGKPGGEAADADLSRSGKAKPAGGKRGGKGIQQQLADALGLSFQLQVIDSGKPNWRSSDMSVDELQRRMEASGADASALLGMLDGNSLSARLVGVLLGFVGSSKTMSATAKLMLVETMAMADRLMENQTSGPMAALGPAMKVIVHDRNAVVIADLTSVIANEPKVRTVAAFYGAGHMPDLEKQLTENLGLAFVEARWFDAVEMDPADAGMTPAQLRSMRAMLQRQFERQTGGKGR